MEVPLYDVGSVVPFVSFGLIVLMSLVVNNSTEVALGLACVVKLVVDDLMLLDVEITWVDDCKVAIVVFSVTWVDDFNKVAIVVFLVTWVDDFKVAIVVFSDVTPVWFGSELAEIKNGTNMQITIIMKAWKNINKPTKIHFLDAILFHFYATPSNVYCFYARS